MVRVLSGLQTQERIAIGKLRQAFEKSKNRKSISLQDRQVIRPSEASELNAANPFARMLLGNALWSEFSDYFRLSETQSIPKVPLFWLSIADVGCMTALDATHIPIKEIVQHLRSGLAGLSYIGMVDPGLYANIQPGTNFSGRTGVNWHLHLFAWGEEQKAMKRRAKRMNRLAGNYRPIVPRPQGEGFNWLPVTEENIVRRFRYMCKTPRKAYRINVVRSPNAAGGTEFSYISSKSLLRSGQHITLFHLLKNLYLDDLLVTGGDGVGLRRRAVRQLFRTSGEHHR